MAAVAALSALARFFSGGDIEGVVTVVLIMLGLGVILNIFYRYVRIRDKTNNVPIEVKLVVIPTVLLTITCGTFATTSLWFGWPIDWRPRSTHLDSISSTKTTPSVTAISQDAQTPADPEPLIIRSPALQVKPLSKGSQQPDYEIVFSNTSPEAALKNVQLEFDFIDLDTRESIVVRGIADEILQKGENRFVPLSRYSSNWENVQRNHAVYGTIVITCDNCAKTAYIIYLHSAGDSWVQPIPPDRVGQARSIGRAASVQPSPTRVLDAMLRANSLTANRGPIDFPTWASARIARGDLAMACIPNFDTHKISCAVDNVLRADDKFMSFMLRISSGIENPCQINYRGTRFSGMSEENELISKLGLQPTAQTAILVLSNEEPCSAIFGSAISSEITMRIQKSNITEDQSVQEKHLICHNFDSRIDCILDPY